MTPEQKEWIDNASLEELLRKWRFGLPGDSLFTGEAGKYYAKILTEKRDTNPEEYTRASKNIGWDAAYDD